MRTSRKTPEHLITKVNNVLQTKKDAVISIANDKLTISVFTFLEQNLNNVKEINFIIRDTKFIPQQSAIAHEFEIAPNDVLYSSYDMVEKNKLKHFSQAKVMHDFIEKHVNIRRTTSSGVMTSNLLIIDDDLLILGSTSLEINPKNKQEKAFDVSITKEMDIDQILDLQDTFDSVWYDDSSSVDFKEEILKSLEFVYREHPPEFLYYFTLNELFGYQLNNGGLEGFERDSQKFQKSEIWESLYEFQKDCVMSAVQKLNKYNGCIIADSVGLGKTFEALAVIKYYEQRSDNVLVLTPAKLYDNWNSFRGNNKSRMFKDLRFNYKIMFHTDLSRKKGLSVSGQEIADFDWGNFDLVVIDESHNFRNRKDRYDEEDNLISTRYSRLLNEVVKEGKNNTKLLLLSATPVNNSLVDLKNQLSIITGDNDNAYEEEGIVSINQLLRGTTGAINAWEKEESKNKNDLLDSLPSNFYKLLEMLTISRSRKHITSYYGNGNVGKFPDKNKPITMRSNVDTMKTHLTFGETDKKLEALTLAVYTPAKYIRFDYQKFYEEKYNMQGKRGGRMDFATQSQGLIVLHRFNLFKRMESSVHSFALTLERLLNKIDSTIASVESKIAVENSLYMDDEEYPEDGFENVIEGKYEIEVSHLMIDDYMNDLHQDKVVISDILSEARLILDYERDQKLEDLYEIVKKKINTTPYNDNNKKIIIFTAFSDTAEYLYQKISPLLLAESVYSALVTGQKVRTSHPNIDSEFNTILCAFSPKSKTKQERPPEEQIDILIGTDCISEGQNLQDCDTVINFDIQWNPVSLIQRFGRVDRIGSTNEKIQMINFFPDMELNDYLRLEQRVKGKMTTLNLVSTGDEDVLTPEMNDFKFRSTQLERLKDEVIDIDDANDNISLTDLNMNEYLYELSEYVKETPEILKIPKGVFSVTDGEEKGVLFCFKHSNDEDKPKSDSSLYPYYLIYVDEGGDLLYGNGQARHVVKLFRTLCYGKTSPVPELFAEFMKDTHNITEMSLYSKLLSEAIASIKGTEEELAMATIFDFSGFNNTFENETVEDFELISFLVVK